MTTPPERSGGDAPDTSEVVGEPGDAGDIGGDPACWADRVCPACGRLDERPRRDGRCPHCGATDEPPPA